MRKVSSQAIELPFSVSASSEVGRIEYEYGFLRIWVHDIKQDLDFVVEFSEAEGFRVMDERDLMEYWPVCSAPHGCLFEVHAHGWLQQENGRTGGCLVHMQPYIREFLVTGINECVSVLSLSPPSVCLQGPNSGR